MVGKFNKKEDDCLMDNGEWLNYSISKSSNFEYLCAESGKLGFNKNIKDISIFRP